MGRLADRAFTGRALRDAWEHVQANDAEDGIVAPGVARFEQAVDHELARLLTELAAGDYRPDDLSEFTLAQQTKSRTLQIPTVRDRIVERAILEVLIPVVDPHLGTASYAYRRRLGVGEAVQAVVACREEELTWVLRTDIHDCFPSLPVERIRRKLDALINDGELMAVIDRLLARLSRGRRGRRRAVPGLPQGSALSPLLANLLLVEVDEALMSAGYSIVRYADDILVATTTKDQAWEAARRVNKIVQELGMSLGADKTEVMSFEDGFAFLGEEFDPRYPPMEEGHGIQEPTRRQLYLSLQGGRVQKSSGRLLVETAHDTVALSIPVTQVGGIVCFGSVGVSAGVRSWAMANDVAVVFATRRGGYLGAMVNDSWPARSTRVRAQLAVSESERALSLGRAVVNGKVRKQVVVLQHFSTPEHVDLVTESVRQLRQTLRLLDDCASRAEIMGVEGACAKVYWPCIGALMPADLRLTLRSRRPPMDLPNAALSFLYTILLTECVTALHAVGIDPGIGILHAEQPHRPSLALDLLEDFRPLVVDQVVLTAVRRRQLQVKHARQEPGKPGILLAKAGRNAILDAYERRMLTRTSGALYGFTGSLRRHVYRQAQRLRATIMEPGTEWTGLTWR